MTGLYLNEQDGDYLMEHDGSFLAVVRAENPRIELWGEDAEQFYGVVPGHAWSAEQLGALVQFYEAGFVAGHVRGQVEKLAEIRRALGVV